MYVRVSVLLKKGGMGVFDALTNTAVLLLASLIILFLNSGTKQQGHTIKGSISSFIVCMCMSINVCLSVCMYVDMFTGWITGFM